MVKKLLTLTGVLLALAACGPDADTGDTAVPVGVFDPVVRATAEGLRDDALKGSAAWDILESLTTEIGPRLVGSEADPRAVAWAVAKFRAMGFDRVWTEPVHLNGWRRVGAEAQILSPYPHDMAITSLGLSVSTPPGGVIAEIAHFETLDDLKAATAEAVRGKIVFISNRMERHRDGSGYGPAVQARAYGAVEAAKRGAIAVIIRSIGTDSHRVPHTGAMRYEDSVDKIAAGAISNPDADILVLALARGAPVRVHLKITNEDLGPIETASVIAEISGREAKDEFVVIGGHLDSWDLGTGAIDDGAGVAITMAAGAMIAALDPRPRRSIRVIAFAAEEVGLYGGKAYAEAHADELDKHIVAAESDFGADRIYAIAGHFTEDSQPALAEIAQVLKPLGISLEDEASHGGPDIGAMVAKGVGGVSLKQDGSGYFDLHHTADDTLDKVEPAALDQNVAAYAAFAYMAAEYPGRFDPPPDGGEKNE